MKRRTLIVMFALVTLLAGGLAFGLTRFLAAKVRPPADAELVEIADPAGSASDALADAGETAAAGRDRGKSQERGRQSRTTNLDTYLRPIMDRSLFDSSKVGSTGAAITNEGEEQEATDLGAALILTAVADDRRFSTALILLEKDDDFPEVFGEGDALADATVDEITRRRVYLMRGNGSREYLEIGGEGAKKKKKAGDSDERADKRKRTGRIDWAEGITKIDDTHYQIERSAVENALANLDRLSRDARVVPNFQDGKSNGFKIFSIKRNSAARNLGLKNNDVLTGVNGTPLTSPDKALELYTQLQSEGHIELDIQRKGEPVTMEYDIL